MNITGVGPKRSDVNFMSKGIWNVVRVDLWWKKLKEISQTKLFSPYFHRKGLVRYYSILRIADLMGCGRLLCIFCFTVSEESTLDIVREVAFISIDGGVSWTAEVLLTFHFSATN